MKGGDRRRSAGGKPPDCVKARRAAATSSLSRTVAALSLLFRDVLRLLQSGLVRTFLSEGGCGDVAGDMRPEYGTGVLISERREEGGAGPDWRVPIQQGQLYWGTVQHGEAYTREGGIKRDNTIILQPA